jgi:pyruvate dehydrogenase E1 component alpha subunit
MPRGIARFGLLVGDVGVAETEIDTYVRSPPRILSLDISATTTSQGMYWIRESACTLPCRLTCGIWALSTLSGNHCTVLRNGKRMSTIATGSQVTARGQLTREDKLRLLKLMCQIRYFEEKAEELYMRGMIHGTMHLSVGEEASAVGSIAALRPEDYILSTHRGHGHCIAKGADINLMMAEFMGKERGYCRGRGGSMHIADVAGGNLGANGVVGGGIPLATGVGLSIQLRQSDQVVMSFFGDGATNQGAFHEALNMGAIWRLPVVYVCENNQYGISMSVRRSMHVQRISDRAAAYGMPGVTVDGNDLLAVYEAAVDAVDKARSGGGPTLLENVTYRWKGHSKSDQNLYRTRDEMDAWRKKCPIRHFRARLVHEGIASEEILNCLDREAAQAIEEAAQFAMASPEPSPQTVCEGVYA